MYEYEIKYLAIIPENQYDDFNSLIRIGKFDCKRLWQVLLEKDINKYTKLGWEVVQIDEDLLNGKVADGYGLFKRKK